MSPQSIQMSKTSFAQALEDYSDALRAMQDGKPMPTTREVIAALTARDHLQTLIADKTQDGPEALLRLFQLDNELRGQAPRIEKVIKLAEWRASLAPPETAWWWLSDKQGAERQKRDTVWLEVLTGTFLVVTTSLALEIIKRLWEGVPDTISILGTLLTILLTTSPFVKQGRELTQALLARLPFARASQHAGIMAIMAGTTFAVLLVVRLWLLPGPLTNYYNNRGVTAARTGNLSLAEQMYRRAAALNPDRVVPTHNLAEAYRNHGLDDKAVELYQQIIERDASFTPAYRGLGELLNQQGEYAAAERVLIAGLNVRAINADGATEKATRYELLANLGWSYWEQKKLKLAQGALEGALDLEAELKTLGAARGMEYRIALPHFYLAQLYEQAGDVDRAQQQWEDSLRFLNQTDWRQRERYLITQEHLQTLLDK